MKRGRQDSQELDGKPQHRRVAFRVAATNTNSLMAHLHLARLLAEQGQLAGASAHFRQVLRLEPRNEEARRFFAEPGSARAGRGTRPADELP